MNKVTVIGDTSSGKTCFLYAMYNFIAMGYVDGFTICANDPIVDANFQKSFEQLENPRLGVNRFPSASQQRDSFIFSLQYGFTEIASFEWADYPGGYIGSKEQELIRDLEESDAWVIFVDGEKMTKAISAIDSQLQENNQTSWYKNDKIEDNIDRVVKKHILPICGKYGNFINGLKKDSIPKSIAIIITKSDIIMNSNITDVEKKIVKCVKKGISPLFTSVSESLISISLVTLGDEIARNNYTGELEPINIEYPITISMLSILKSLFDKKFSEVARLRQLIIEDREKFFSSAKKRQQWQTEIDKITPYLDKWQKMAKAILGTLSDNKKLYIRGEELSMVEYYQKVFLITKN